MPSYLTSVSGSSTSNSYTYDRYGNRTQQTSSPSGPNPSFSFNPANNRMVGGYYDAAGNITGDGIHSYTYDAEGNVLTADSTSYAYDAMNRRVASSNGTANVGYGTAAEFLYDPFGHRTSTWITSINFGNEGRIYWGNQQIAYRAFNGQTYFEHQNWLGTERMRTNYQGQIAKTSVSLAFGDGFAQSSTDPYGPAQDNNEFAGLDHDSESNTDHAQFRQYSPTQGRWMSPDPYDGSYDWSDPQSLNRYAYVDNNPLSYTDPTGQNICSRSIAVGAAFGPVGEGIGIGLCIGSIINTAAHVVEDIFGLFAHAPFTASTAQRPGQIWSERGAYHPKPYSGPAGALGDIFGLGNSGCEFGACGFQQGADPNHPYSTSPSDDGSGLGSPSQLIALGVKAVGAGAKGAVIVPAKLLFGCSTARYIGRNGAIGVPLAFLGNSFKWVPAPVTQSIGWYSTYITTLNYTACKDVK